MKVLIIAILFKASKAFLKITISTFLRMLISSVYSLSSLILLSVLDFIFGFFILIMLLGNKMDIKLNLNSL